MLRQILRPFPPIVAKTPVCLNKTQRKTTKYLEYHHFPPYICNVERNKHLLGDKKKSNNKILIKNKSLMKKSILYLAAFICMMMQSVSTFASDRMIPAEQLPATAKTFIQKTFPGQTIAYAQIDYDNFGKTYEVRLNNGTQVEFDTNGTWDKVDCYYSAVPANLVPTAIANYVKNHFAGSQIVKIDKERYGYEVELSNDLDLKFNKQGSLIAFDD